MAAAAAAALGGAPKHVYRLSCLFTAGPLDLLTCHLPTLSANPPTPSEPAWQETGLELRP